VTGDTEKRGGGGTDTACSLRPDAVHKNDGLRSSMRAACLILVRSGRKPNSQRMSDRH